MGKWLDRMTTNPTDWLLEKACPSIRFRTLTEVLGRPADDPDVAAAREETYNYVPATKIASAQTNEGIWFGSIDGFETPNPSRNRGPGTLYQYFALIEYGWGKDHPIIWETSQLLQALMWQDPSVDLCELNGYLGGDSSVETWIRGRLSRAALALLTRSGFEDDAGVKMKAAELVPQIDAFYQGDVEAKMYTGTMTREKEVDGKMEDEICHVVDKDALYPDVRLMTFLAYSPEIAGSEAGRDIRKRVCDYVLTHKAPEVVVYDVAGKIFDIQDDLGIRRYDREEYKEGNLIGRLLHDLEILARCDALVGNERAVDLLQMVIDYQDEEGVVRPDDMIEKIIHRVDYPYFPLEDNWRGKHKKYSDVTFRLLLILDLLDRAKAD